MSVDVCSIIFPIISSKIFSAEYFRNRRDLGNLASREIRALSFQLSRKKTKNKQKNKAFFALLMTFSRAKANKRNRRHKEAKEIFHSMLLIPVNKFDEQLQLPNSPPRMVNILVFLLFNPFLSLLFVFCIYLFMIVVAYSGCEHCCLV